MPIYEYLCVNKHRFEIRQGFDAATVSPCPTCNTDARRVIRPPAVHYKGSGFYTTDYGRSSGYQADAKRDSGDTTAAAPAKEGPAKGAAVKESAAKDTAPVATKAKAPAAPAPAAAKPGKSATPAASKGD